MGNVCRHTLGLLVISALLLAPSLAGAANDVLYLGETPTGSGIANDVPVVLDGIDEYLGANFSHDYWDYVYSITNVGNDGPPNAAEPDYWAIATDYQPDAIFQDEDGLDWSGHWDDRIITGEYASYFDGSALIGRSAVIWQWNGSLQSTPLTGVFHFQSTYAPGLQPWVTSGGGTAYDDVGFEWSSTPEPASMALYGLSLLGIGYWRRRKTT